MAYTDRFIPTDNLINNLRPYLATVTDAAVLSSFAGFLSVSGVTVYELAIKDIFNEFALKKNKVFGHFMQMHLGRINGRIQIEDLRKNQIKLFGVKYDAKFDKDIKQRESTTLTAHRISIKSSYKNLITCRHDFVHKGSPTLTVNEVIDSYTYGKEIIHCLNDSMKR